MNTANLSAINQDDHNISPKVEISKLGTSRNNNFNFLRLLFATLVILAHTPEFADGNRQREILTSIFGTLSFGELAVNGFFTLSGFLIVQSWQRSPEMFDFFKKRVLRIYPAFIVASIVCIFVVGPFAATNVPEYFARLEIFQIALNIIFLKPPDISHVFEGTPYPFLNGAMWTIGYEFRCYMFVALMGLCGVINRRHWWLGLTLLILGLYFMPNLVDRISFPLSDVVFGTKVNLVRLSSFFCAGGCFYLYRDKIPYKLSWGVVAFILLFISLFSVKVGHVALVILGSYLLFYFAQIPFSLIERFKSIPDVSYGAYLYGWPVQKLLLWYLPTLPLSLVFILTCALCTLVGLLSWNLIEQPCLRLIKKPKSKNVPILNDGAVNRANS